ncbi:MAG: hypothetical protein ACK5V2_13305 [Pseudomonadota bacterium]|jgi:hypothetical protein
MLAQLPTGGSNGTLLAQVPSEVNPLEAVGNLFVTAVAILGAAVNAGVQYAPELWKKMTDTLAKLGAWGQGVSSKLQQFTEQQQKAFVAAVTTGPVPATLSELRQRVEEAVRTVTAGSSNEPTQARPAPTSRTTPPVTPPETQTKPAPPPTLKPIESAEDPPKATSTQAERSRAQQANATKARQEMQSYISNPIRSDVDLATNWNGLSYWYSGASIGPRPDLPPGVSLTSILREGQKELLTRRVASLEAAIRGLDRNDPQLQGKIRDIDTQLRQFQSFVAGKGLPRAMQTMVAERVEALRGMLRGVGQMAAGDVGRSEQVAAPSQKGERPAAAPTELEASVLRVVDASKAAADALAQEQSLPATASPEQRKAAHEEAVRRGEALRDLLGRPEIVGLMSRGLVAAAGGAPQPPDERPLYEMLLNGLASALTQSVVDAAQPLVGGQPVPLLQQVRNALEAGLISMVVPQGAGLTGAALANMTEAGLQSVLRGDTPEQTGMNMALGGALGATVHGLLRLLGGGPGPRLQPEGGVMPADGSAPAPKPNGPESPVAIQGSEPPSRPPAAGDAPGSSPDPSARSDATPPGQTPRGAPVPDRAGSRYGYESVQSLGRKIEEMAPPGAGLPPLSPRELEVSTAFAMGAGNDLPNEVLGGVLRRLGIADIPPDTARRALLERLGYRHSAELRNDVVRDAIESLPPGTAAEQAATLSQRLPASVREAFLPGELAELVAFHGADAYGGKSIGTARLYVPGSLFELDARMVGTNMILNNYAYAATRSADSSTPWQDVMVEPGTSTPRKYVLPDGSPGMTAQEFAVLAEHMPAGTESELNGARDEILNQVIRSRAIVEIALDPSIVPHGANPAMRGYAAVGTTREGNFYLGMVGVIPSVTVEARNVSRDALAKTLGDGTKVFATLSDGRTQAVNSQNIDSVLASNPVSYTYKFVEGRELVARTLTYAERRNEATGQQFSMKGEAVTPAIVDFYLKTGAKVTARMPDGTEVPITSGMLPSRANPAGALPSGVVEYKLTWNLDPNSESYWRKTFDANARPAK